LAPPSTRRSLRPPIRSSVLIPQNQVHDLTSAVDKLEAELKVEREAREKAVDDAAMAHAALSQTADMAAGLAQQLDVAKTELKDLTVRQLL
jgi:multidrug resistance efflux pump